MRPGIMLTILLLAGWLAQANAVRADAIALPAGPAKVAPADVIVVGQVAAIEDQDVQATPHPGSPNKATYRIAVIQVSETLKGDPKLKSVRLGFILFKNGLAQPPFKGGYNPQMTVGQAGLFYLKRHHDGNFYTLPMFGCFVSSQAKQPYEHELELIRKTMKVLENPLAALKDADAAKRLEAAYHLVTVYRGFPFGAPVTEMVPIPAEESKLILKTLLESDWDINKYQGEKFQQNPAQLLVRLNVGAQDGFQPPANQGIHSPAYTAAAKAWLEKNWETYRIKKIIVVPAKAAPKPGASTTPSPTPDAPQLGVGRAVGATLSSALHSHL